jgi:hypothetical protein
MLTVVAGSAGATGITGVTTLLEAEGTGGSPGVGLVPGVMTIPPSEAPGRAGNAVAGKVSGAT